MRDRSFYSEAKRCWRGSIRVGLAFIEVRADTFGGTELHLAAVASFPSPKRAECASVLRTSIWHQWATKTNPAEKGNPMRCGLQIVLAGALLLVSPVIALGDNVRTDYNHQTNFSQYHTYSWGKVTTKIPFYADRIKQEVNLQFQAKGWHLMDSGGAVTVFASDSLHNQQETQTMYDGFGGGWGGGWGWGGWGWGGGWADPGLATTTTTNQQTTNLVIDIFESNSKNLLWRGLATADLSGNSSKNAKSMDDDISKMFKGFPPKPSK
jgi:hypothetical protein